jgi:tetratricopeptide (TPR) repeat protein
MPDCRRARIWLLPWVLLLPLLPACSLVPMQPPVLEGVPPETLQLVREQSAELEQLLALNKPTPAQQQHIKQLRRSLGQFEREIIHTASQLEIQNDWHGAEQFLQGATGILPNSQALISAQQTLAQRRQVREERVRMELAIHRGEQLLKDAEAYRRLQQLKGPDMLTWVEVKNYYRKCRETAQALYDHAQLAIAREDYVLAQRGLNVARGLYGEELYQDRELRDGIERDLAQTRRRLQRAQPQPASVSPGKDDQQAITELRQAMEAGDLLRARQLLNQLEQQSPQHSQLPPLQSQLQALLDNRVESAIKQGNDLYSRGEIKRALQIWREAEFLDPDNVELLANIARAEKVLQNLRALSTPSGAAP